MSYDEHLISMAGGDGDMLEAIQRHGAILTEWEQFLLDKVREQAAKLEAVRLHVWRWHNEYEDAEERTAVLDRLDDESYKIEDIVNGTDFAS